MEAVSTERRLAAILAADVVGYSRLVEKCCFGCLRPHERTHSSLTSAPMCLWRHTVVQHADNLDNAGLHNAIENHMHRFVTGASRLSSRLWRM